VTTNQALFGLALTVVLAVGSQVLAKSLRIPALIVLLPVGFAAGAMTSTPTTCWARRSSRWCHWRWR
jgi:NhaP-type Na+/H+ or K+/H+ antiporter